MEVISLPHRVHEFLKELGLDLRVYGPELHVHEDVYFETPVQFNGNLTTPLRVGAYSFVGRNFTNYTALTIGRFCSIADDVKIGL